MEWGPRSSLGPGLLGVRCEHTTPLPPSKLVSPWPVLRLLRRVGFPWGIPCCSRCLGEGGYAGPEGSPGISGSHQNTCPADPSWHKLFWQSHSSPARSSSELHSLANLTGVAGPHPGMFSPNTLQGWGLDEEATGAQERGQAPELMGTLKSRAHKREAQPGHCWRGGRGANCRAALLSRRVTVEPLRPGR